MGEKRIVKLHFRSAIHLGSNITGIGIEGTRLVAHSDTLFSCLINAYAQLHSGNLNTVNDLLARFHEGEPPFRLSSAFPYVDQIEGGDTYYLPKPLNDPPDFYDGSEGQRYKEEHSKIVNNTQLLELNYFQKWLTGKNVGLDDLKKQDIEKDFISDIRPQHARDRLTDATTIYHTGLVHFHGRSGLYFLVELNDLSLLNWDMFREILTQAGMNGLGGRRSHGNGIFKVTDSKLDYVWKELFDLDLPEKNGFVNLSLYYPEIKEEFDNLDPIAYQLIPRKGWCYSSVVPTQMKRKTVTMFSEGAVFRNEPKGALADGTPDSFTTHKVYRYGIPITLPIHILEEKDDIS